MKVKLSFILPGTLILAGALALGLSNSTRDSPKPRFELHEWGTFTSVFASDGTLLHGLEGEEESLPPFVHAHAGMEGVARPTLFSPVSKGFQRPLHHVSVKMETPVIYFYSDEPFRAHVEVGFKGGSISQWFPQRSGGETPPPIERSKGRLINGPIDFAEPYSGAIAWDVEVLEKSAENDSRVFQGGETLNWTHPRMTDANVIRSDHGEHEKYLFYRGVGNFESTLQPHFLSNETLYLTNSGKETISTLLIFERRPDGTVRFSFRKKLEAGESQSYLINQTPEEPSNWQRPVYEQFVASLVSAGLFQREADAMARTWWDSYFARPGLRVFWLMPEKQLQERLPLTVSPRPEKTARVMVGRSEILTPAFEIELLKAHAEDKMDHYRNHFYKAYSERLEQLLEKNGEESKLSLNH